MLNNRYSISFIAAMLAVAGFFLGAGSVFADNDGSSASNPFLIKEEEAILVQPPATVPPGLNFSGIAFRRYQPDAAAMTPIDDANSSLYTSQIEILGQNEWVVTLYNLKGELQMTTVEIENTPTQVFQLNATTSALQRYLFSSADSLDVDPQVGVSEHNIRANETIFRFESDFLYRTENNVEWRLPGESFFFRLNDDFFPPDVKILLNGTKVTGPVGNIAYNDATNIFGLWAMDPDEISGNAVGMSGLAEFRYQWFPNTGQLTEDTCNNFWTLATATGSAAVWTAIPGSSLVSPDNEDFYQLAGIKFTDYAGHKPGSYSLCFQAKDEVGNIGSVQGKFQFVQPNYASLNCVDYQAYIAESCTGAECQQLTMAGILMGYGRSSLASLDIGLGTNIGNTILCETETNSPAGYKLGVRSADATSAMTNTNSLITDQIVSLSNGPDTPAAWNVAATEAKWGLRLHSGSGGEIYKAGLWGGDSYETGKFSGVTTANQTLYVRNSNLHTSDNHDEPSAEDNALIQFGAEIGSSARVTSGTYRVNLEFTMTTLDEVP